MYCRNCGKQIDDQAVVCVGCGVPPKKARNFCQNCGQQTDPMADVCVSCGSRLATMGTLSTAGDTGLAVLAHILGLFFGFLAPLIIWLVKGKESEFVEDQAKEALNFQISMFIYFIGSLILAIIVIGALLAFALAIFEIIVCILAAISANKGERYRYPLCIRFIK